MPELPEVQTVVNTLRPAALGRHLAAVLLHRPDILQPFGFDLVKRLKDRSIHDISRRAKKIIFTLDDGGQFYIHLGMTGRLTLEPPDAPTLKHTHLVLQLTATTPRSKPLELRFVDPRRFGGIWWICDDEPCDRGIGPEPLLMRTSQLAKNLSRTRRAIKSALLDQAVVAGLGNIYVDESLFAAGIHPLTAADRLGAEAVARLTIAIKKVLRRALRHRGSTLRDYRDANGESGGFQLLHAVYARAGKRCLKCGSAIQRIVLGGRSTHFCLRCQPAPRRSDRAGSRIA